MSAVWDTNSMMKKSIFSKIITGYFVIIIALSSLIILYSFYTIRDHYINTLTSKLRNTALVLTPYLMPYIREGEFSTLDSEVKRIGSEIDTRITVIRPNGVVLADSRKNPAHMENHIDRPEIVQALKGEVGSSTRFSTTVKANMRYVAVPVMQDGQVISVIRVSLFLKDINNLLSVLKTKILQISLMVILISLISAYLFARTLSTPIRELAEGSQKVAEGDFDVNIYLKNRDELRNLADNFNHMTKQVKTLFNDISLQKEELTSIISSIQEGLIVLDREGLIRITNRSFSTISGKENIEGKPYWEVFRDPDLDAFIKKVIQRRHSLSEELPLFRGSYICSATFIPSSGEIVLLFYDITEMKDLEQLKKDFVANVSHELRTPLTAIKGFIETLSEDIDEKNRRYIDILKRHTDRLINIVNDLLMLSELEEAKEENGFGPVDISAILTEIGDLFSLRCAEKNISLKTQISDNLPRVQGNSFKLEQAFINLVENALKYTPEGSITISSYSEDKGDSVSVRITDTGIGISEKDQQRIFERFFVVDKSRSRKMGGTGLGLSIVKHVVMMHSGTIEIESSPGTGTSFTVNIPADPS